jgi:hypothetical protein
MTRHQSLGKCGIPGSSVHNWNSVPMEKKHVEDGFLSEQAYWERRTGEVKGAQGKSGN